MQNIKSNTVLVLDLDDTLYRESDYVESGIRHIAAFIHQVKDIELTDTLLSFYRQNPRGDFLQLACKLSGLPETAKDSLLWTYRLHTPVIRLAPDTVEWLRIAAKEYLALAILTDGRSITQRLKLAALGLSSIPAFISEDWNSLKPDQKRFLEIQNKWPSENYIYIGDNPKKDFLAPNKLGWLSVGFKGGDRNVHSQDEPINAEYQPKFWINNFKELDNFLLEVADITC